VLRERAGAERIREIPIAACRKAITGKRERRRGPRDRMAVDDLCLPAVHAAASDVDCVRPRGAETECAEWRAQYDAAERRLVIGGHEQAAVGGERVAQASFIGEFGERRMHALDLPDFACRKAVT